MPISQDQPLQPVGEASPRPLRADAERNRRLILDTAAAVFAERGLGAGFDEIARAAGVGTGTVYRRFPDRDDLIDAVFAERILAVVDVAVQASEIEDPWVGLEWFMEHSIALQAGNRGLAEAMGEALRGRARIEAARAQLLPAIGLIVDRAHEAGMLRPDVGVLDLGVIGSMLVHVGTRERPESWRRYLNVALDGLRMRPDSVPLCGSPPVEDDLASIASRLRGVELTDWQGAQVDAPGHDDGGAAHSC